MVFTLKVEGFADGESIPARFTCDGDNASPALSWSGDPPETQSFVLIVDDPDAPAGTWNHWLLWDVPAHVHSIAEDFRPGAVGCSGKNDFGKPGYGGPCPPRGHGAHRYYFTIHAVDRPALGLPPGAKRQELDRALKNHVLARAQYMGRYERGR